MATVIGTIELIARIDTSQYKRGAAQIDSTNKSIERSTTGSTANQEKSWKKMGIVIGAVASAATAVFNRLFDFVGNAVSTAVKRVDTLNNSQRTFENLGFAADDVKTAISNLDQSVRGLPTSLDEGIRGMTNLAATYNDVNKGQQVFTALNNAILGFGGNAENVRNAIIQLSQVPLDGPLDAQTWNSLRNSGLTPALAAIARDMGVSLGELKGSLGAKGGKLSLTVRDLTDSLIKLNKDGSGSMKSFEQIAKDSTAGISTGWANMQTAIARGLAKIISAIGAANISGAITNIGKAFEKSLTFIAGFVGHAVRFAQAMWRAADSIAGFIRTWLPLLSVLAGYLVIIKIYDAIKALQIAFNIMRLITLPSLIASIQATWAALLANPIILVAALMVGLAVLIIQHWSKVKRWLGAFWTWLKKAALGALNFIKSIFVGIGAWFRDRFNTARDGIVNAFNSARNSVKSIFENLVAFFKNLPGRFVKGLGNIANTLVSPFKTAFNAIASLWNNTVGKISFKAPSWVPKFGGKGWSMPTIPQLALGGIVTSPTLAMIGEGNEAEAVIPLSKLDKLMSGGNSNDVKIVVNLSGIMTRSRTDERSIAKSLIESINQELRAKQLPEIGGGALRGTA